MIGLELIRKQSGMSLADLSTKLEVSRQFISKWERGEKQIPKKYLSTLSEIYGFSQDVFQEELDEIGKLKLQSIHLQKAIDDSAYEYSTTTQDESGNEIPFHGTYIDPSLQEELHSTQARINNAVTLKKISSVVDSKDTPDLTNELFYRFADLVDAINDPSLLFIVIHSLEQYCGVNVGKYGGFGKEDYKKGKISSENVFVEQFTTLYEKTISAISKKG